MQNVSNQSAANHFYYLGSPVRSRPGSSAGAISSFTTRKSTQDLWSNNKMVNGGM